MYALVADQPIHIFIIRNQVYDTNISSRSGRTSHLICSISSPKAKRSFIQIVINAVFYTFAIDRGQESKNHKEKKDEPLLTSIHLIVSKISNDFTFQKCGKYFENIIKLSTDALLLKYWKSRRKIRKENERNCFQVLPVYLYSLHFGIWPFQIKFV